jgi:cell division protein FtsB
LKIKKQRKKPLRLLFAAVILGLLIYASIGAGKSVYRIWRLSGIKRTEERKLERAREEKLRLENEIERLKSDSLYIEEIAREEYGMVKEGEEVFEITLPDSSSGGNK